MFLELGFQINWEADGLVGFQKNACKFILQNYDDKHFAENPMLRLTVENLDDFWTKIIQKELSKKFNIKLQVPTYFPWGREINLIDLTGVCWHIAEAEV